MGFVVGESSSRLNELRKSTINGSSISDLYFTSTSPNNDGVNPIITNTAVTWTYYIGGITYIYDVVEDKTRFIFSSKGYDDPNNFTNSLIFKDPTKNNTIDVPEIINNVFITRQSQSVFEDIYRLESITSLSALNEYAGGAYFNVIDNEND